MSSLQQEQQQQQQQPAPQGRKGHSVRRWTFYNHVATSSSSKMVAHKMPNTQANNANSTQAASSSSSSDSTQSSSSTEGGNDTVFTSEAFGSTLTLQLPSHPLSPYSQPTSPLPSPTSPNIPITLVHSPLSSLPPSPVVSPHPSPLILQPPSPVLGTSPHPSPHVSPHPSPSHLDHPDLLITPESFVVTTASPSITITTTNTLSASGSLVLPTQRSPNISPLNSPRHTLNNINPSLLVHHDTLSPNSFRSSHHHPHSHGHSHSHHSHHGTHSPNSTHHNTLSPNNMGGFSSSLSPIRGSSLAGAAPSSFPHSPRSISPGISPTISPNRSPNASPLVSPSVSPHVSPSVSPHVSPNVSPNISPHVSPNVSPHVSPHVSPNVSPHVSPCVSPHISPCVSPHLSPHSPPVYAQVIMPVISISGPISPNHPSLPMSPDSFNQTHIHQYSSMIDPTADGIELVPIPVLTVGMDVDVVEDTRGEMGIEDIEAVMNEPFTPNLTDSVTKNISKITEKIVETLSDGGLSSRSSIDSPDDNIGDLGESLSDLAEADMIPESITDNPNMEGSSPELMVDPEIEKPKRRTSSGK